MVRRSPQKKKNKPGTPRPASNTLPGTSGPGESSVAPEEGGSQTAVNWWSGSTPSLAPDSEPWTPSGHGAEWDRTRSPLRSPTKPLEQQVSSLQAQREAADADLWNARVELQDHAQQKEADKERIAKLTADLARLRTDHEHDSQMLDELRSREEELKTHLERERAKAARDRQTVREQIEDRDGFIENLQAQLDDLRGELKAASHVMRQRRPNQEDTSGDVSSATGDITSLTIDLDNDPNVAPPPASAVPQTVGVSELMSQTHQARQQRLLRSALQKQRLENFQLRQQLAELRGAPAPQWEGQESDEDDQSSSERRFEDASDSLGPGFLTDPIAHEVPQVPAGVPLSEDFVDEVQLQRDAEHLGLAVIPQQELAELQRRHSDAASIDTLTAELRKKYDAHVVPSDEFEALKNPGMDLLHDQAHAINHRLVPIREYEELQNTHSARANLKLTDDELKLAYELLRGRRRSKSKVQSHVLQDLARVQALGLAPDVSHRYSDSSREASVSPSRAGSRHQRSFSHSSSVSDAESGYGDSQSMDNGVGVALRQIAHNHGFELVSDSVAGSRELAQRHGLITVPLDHLSKISNSRIVSSGSDPHTDEVVLSLSQADSERLQKLLELSPNELSELQRRAYTPTAADLTEQAASLGLAVLPLEAVAEMKGQLRQRNVPDASSVAELAQKAGLRVIPEHPTLDELRDVAPEDAVLVERETWAALEYPEPATLRRLAKVHGLAVLPEEEVKHLQQRAPETAQPPADSESTDTLSIESVRKAAQAHDLVVLSADDYREILASRQTRDFSNLPMAARTEHFEKLIRSSQESRISATSPRESPTASSLGSLSDRITRLGFVPVEQEEYKRLLASQKVYEPTKSDILRSAKQFGLATMPLEEYARLRSSHWNSPSKSAKDSSFGASKTGSPRAGSPVSKTASPSKGKLIDDEEFEGFKAVPSEYLAALRRIVEHPTRSDVEGIARKAGLTVSSELNDKEVLQKAKELGLVEPLTPPEIIEAAKGLGLVYPLSDDEIILRAKALGLVEPTDDESSIIEKAKRLGLAEPLNEDVIIDKARALGLVDPLSEVEILTKAKILGLAEPLAESEILKIAKAKGLIDPLSDQDIILKAKNYGLIEPLSEADILEAARSKGLVDPLSDSDIISHAKSLGLVEPLADSEILSNAKSLGLIEPLGDHEILDAARTKGLVDPLSEEEILVKAKALGLSEPLAESEILDAARSKGLVDPLSEEDILVKAKALGLSEPLAESEILDAARSKGLVDPLSESEILARAKSLGLAEPLTEPELLSKGKSLGLIDPLSETEIITRAKSLGLAEPLTEPEILHAARAKGLVDPLSETEIITRAKSLGLIEPLTDSAVIEKARAKGLVDPPSESEIVARAKSLGLVDPLTESDIIEKAKSLGLSERLSDSDIIETAKTKGLIDPQDKEHVVRSVRSLIPNDQSMKQLVIELAKENGLVEPYSEDQIREHATQLGLVEKPSNDAILAHAEKLGHSKPLTDSQIRERAKALGLVEALSDTQILERAKALGLQEPLSDNDIEAKAQSLGLVHPLSNEEILGRAKDLGMVEPLNESQIREKAKSLGLIEPLEKDDLVKKAKEGLLHQPSDSEILDRAKNLGLVEPLSDSHILERAKSLGLTEPLTKKEITSRAEEIGMAYPLSNTKLLESAKSKGLVEPYSEDQIREIAKSLGMVEPLSDSELIRMAKSKGLTEPLSEQDIIELSKARGLVEPLSESQLLEAAKKRGLVEKLSDSQIVEAAKSLGLVTPPSDVDILASAKRLGLMEPLTEAQLLDMAQSRGLTRPLTDSQVVESAKKLGLVDPPTKEDILASAKSLGLVEPSSGLDAETVYGDKPSNSPSASEKTNAKDNGQGVVLADLNGSELSSSLNNREFAGVSHSQGPTATPENSHAGQSLHSRQSSTSEAPNDAAAAAIAPRRSKHARDESIPGKAASSVPRKPVGSPDPTRKAPVAPPPVPERIRDDLDPSPSLNLAGGGIPYLGPKTFAPATETILSDSSRGDPSVSYGPDGPGQVTASGLPQRLGRSPGRRDVRRYEVTTAPRSPTKGMSRSTTSSSLYAHHHNRAMRGSQSNTGPLDTFNLPMPRSSSFNHHHHGPHSRYATSLAESTGSSWAVETLTGEAAEFNVNQIILGEVLYKYTSSGFNLEGLTGGRHKRYFWFRPDSMVLFWHRENPHFLAGLYGPAKCITVLGVEEFSDRNPLPAGLFHRSILIRGRERDLRVTCSTPSRHQVWLSSLKYVLKERSGTNA